MNLITSSGLSQFKKSLLPAVCFFGLASAQDIALTGTVSSEAGNPISGAEVTLVGEGLTTTTDSEGNYEFSRTVNIMDKAGFIHPEISLAGNEIRLSLYTPKTVAARVYNSKGRTVASIPSAVFAPGSHRLGLTDLSRAGMYTLVLVIGNKKYTRQLLSLSRGELFPLPKNYERGELNRPQKKASDLQDNLRVTAQGYIPVELAVENLVGTLDVVMAAVPEGEITSWDSYTLNVLDFYDNKGISRDLDRQDIISNFESQIGTTEILIVSASNGNSSGNDKQTDVFGGGWGDRVAYGGDDDKSVEIWFRQVTASNQNSMGEVDAKGAYTDFGVVVYNGLLTPGEVTDKKLSSDKPNINCAGSGPWLVAAVTDNGKDKSVPGSDKADEEYFSKKDDRTFVYLTDDKSFNDNSAFSVRGAIACVELK